MWQITYDDVESIAIGAGILGTGGGGNPYLGRLLMQSLIEQGRTATVIRIEDIADDALVTEVGGMGAPTVGIEKLPNGEEPRWVIEALERYIGRPIDAIICAEIGGANSIQPLVAAALTGKPVLDGDGMGRAFPELQMSTHFIDGAPCTPAALVDEKNNCIIFGSITDPYALEKFARDLCILMGCRAELAVPVMTGAQVKRSAVRSTLSLSKRLGDAVRLARARKTSITDAILAVTGGAELFIGKLVDVQRRTTGGFARGEILVEGLGRFHHQWMRVAFQNENLVAWMGDQPEACDQVVICVPDLICLIETESGEPVTTEQLRYGLRMTVLGIPCSDKLRTPLALKVVGPAAFGYPEVTYVPMPKVTGVGLE
ncbi:MAG: DUF917 domain-containing protein [Caldilinea sp.]|jgi:DUF917 family protein|uniref:DUF917 domain-containing protein n=1 Tax=Caldilinea sp. TaxID=2293560 RepID=UPI0030AEC30D